MQMQYEQQCQYHICLGTINKITYDNDFFITKFPFSKNLPTKKQYKQKVFKMEPIIHHHEPETLA
jgi:hypothetical protein